MKVHLEEYLEKSQKVMDDNQLYLLCIQCFEVSYKNTQNSQVHVCTILVADVFIGFTF